MKYKLVILLFIICVSISTKAQTAKKISSPTKERTMLFDNNWLFKKDSTIDASSVNFDDRSWRKIDLPHDWSIEDLEPQIPGKTIGPFDTASIGKTATGFVDGGTGWYRKRFRLPNVQNKKVYLDFDGVYMVSDVWINGHHAGTHHYGYTPFIYEISQWLKNGEENVIAVKVENKGQNSRWYSGSGIYRHVWLSVVDPLHIAPRGIYITTPDVLSGKAVVQLKASIDNENNQSYTLRTAIISPDGKTVAALESKPQNNGEEVVQNISIASPKLWSVDKPNLYKARTQLIASGKLVDEETTTFGIRTLSFTAQNGFLLNGKKVLLKGGCMHHDNGPLGSATIDRAEERKVEILKQNGFNAIRTSHNPPSRQLLDACDRIGMLVIDEAFDMWEHPKNPDDYHLYFDEDAKKDLTSYILGDRNHPSVILWSIGNEIYERADTSGVRIGNELSNLAHQLDPTRKVTAAICGFWDHPGHSWKETAPAFSYLDVGGYNYQWQQYVPDHEIYPQRIMMGTESVPKEALENWHMVESNSYVIGDFVWTAVDYMGETAIGHTRLSNEKDSFTLGWPWYDSWCGDIDLIGYKKPQSYYRDVVWRRSAVEILVHRPLPDSLKENVSYWGWPDETKSWTWKGQEGKTMQVRVFSRAHLVRLELNGKMIYEKEIPDNGITAVFEVPYQPGTLKAIAIDNGKEIGSVMLQTVTGPKKLKLTADRNSIKANRNDLSYITAEVVDEHGNIDPDAETPVHFSVNGDGELKAVGSANPTDMSSFQQGVKKTFRGRCIAIVRPFEKTGTIQIKAEAEGLPSQTITMQVR